MVQTRSREDWIRFLTFAAVVVAACFYIWQFLLPVTTVPDLLAYGIAGDLLFTIPALYYFFLVRTRTVRPASVIIVMLVCVRGTLWVIPTHTTVLPPLLFLLSVGIEITFLYLLVRAILHYRQQIEASRDTTSGDRFEQFQGHLQKLFPNHFLIPMIAMELSVLYYGMIGWRLRPIIPEDATAYSTYDKSGWKGLSGALGFLILTEGSIAHVLLSRISVSFAWGWTILDVWAILWLVSDYQLMRLRPLLLRSDRLTVRLGARWSGEVLRDNIARIVTCTGNRVPEKRKDYVKIAPIGDPDFVLVLKEPVSFTGPFGISRQTRLVGIQSDDPTLQSVLEAVHNTAS